MTCGHCIQLSTGPQCDSTRVQITLIIRMMRLARHSPPAHVRCNAYFKLKYNVLANEIRGYNIISMTSAVHCVLRLQCRVQWRTVSESCPWSMIIDKSITENHDRLVSTLKKRPHFFTSMYDCHKDVMPIAGKWKHWTNGYALFNNLHDYPILTNSEEHTQGISNELSVTWFFFVKIPFSFLWL